MTKETNNNISLRRSRWGLRYLERIRMAPAPFVRVGRYRGLFAAFYRKDGPHGVITEKWPRRAVARGDRTTRFGT